MSIRAAHNLNFNGARILNVDNYKYLGKYFEVKGDHKMHIKAQCMKGVRNAATLSKFMMKGKGLSIIDLRAVVTGLLHAQIEYGLKMTTIMNND